MKRSLAVVALGLLVAFSSGGPGPELKPGAPAPDFTLKNIDGKMVSLQDFASGKGAIVTFTCNHCPYAKAYEDRLIAIDKKYKALGYPVVAINPNDVAQEPTDSYENMQKRAQEKGFTFPYLIDETQAIAAAYGATRTPHLFVVRFEGGKGVIRYVGAIDDNSKDAAAVSKTYLADALDALIAEKTPGLDYTKAVGCTIKWREQ